MPTSVSKSSIDRAMKRAKGHFGNECIVTGQANPDGAHIHPRSTHPWLRDREHNIVPLARHVHHILDQHEDGTVRRPVERIRWLMQHVQPENRDRLKDWLLGLLEDITGAA
jgi:hypothetical protein